MTAASRKHHSLRFLQYHLLSQWTMPAAEETYHEAIKRTLEKTEALEKHVKTVTMRADSLMTTEADFFQKLIERQEETIRELKILYGQLCQPRHTQW